MVTQSEMATLFQKWNPYLAMILLQFGYAGMNIITKLSLNGGMSHYVLVVYRHAFATVSIAPFALIIERKTRPKMTFWIFTQIFVLGLLGPVIDQNLYYAGLKYTSPTFSCAMSNILPAMTFVMAVLCRMEKIEMKKVRSQAKVAGTLVTVSGAMVMTLYKGPLVDILRVHSGPTHRHTAIDATNWFKGSILLIIATWSWAALFIIQAYTLKRYTAQLSLTTLICLLGTVQSIAVTFVMERNLSLWRIGWDINLFAAAYAGIVTSSIAYYVQGLVINRKGPVFASAFSPLMMIVVAVMGAFILSEQIFLGGIIGAVLIVVGLYSVLWGKHKETDDDEDQKEKDINIPVVALVKSGNHEQCPEVVADEIDLEKEKEKEKFKIAA